MTGSNDEADFPARFARDWKKETYVEIERDLDRRVNEKCASADDAVKYCVSKMAERLMYTSRVPPYDKIDSRICINWRGSTSAHVLRCCAVKVEQLLPRCTDGLREVIGPAWDSVLSLVSSIDVDTGRRTKLIRRVDLGIRLLDAVIGTIAIQLRISGFAVESIPTHVVHHLRQFGLRPEDARDSWDVALTSLADAVTAQ